MLIFRSGKAFVLPKMQRKWRRKLETDWTRHDNSLLSFKESKFTHVVADIHHQKAPSLSRFSCPSLYRLCWLWCALVYHDAWMQFAEDHKLPLKTTNYSSKLHGVGNCKLDGVDNNNNNNNILYSSQPEIKAVVRSHNEERISIILRHETHAHTHS